MTGRYTVICVETNGRTPNLTLGKAYATIPDREAQQHYLLRVIDDSGENYLYPGHMFEDEDD